MIAAARVMGNRASLLLGILIALGAALAAARTPAATPTAPGGTPDRAKTEQALQTVVDQLNDLDSWFTNAEAQRARWLKQVLAQDRQVAELSRAVEAAEQALQQTEQEIAALERRHRTLEAQRGRQADKIAQHLASAHRLGGQDFVKLLLNQQDPNVFDRLLRYHGYFSAARAETLARYQATLDELAASQAALTAKAERARRERDQLKAEERALTASRAERQVLLADLDAQREDKAVQRERLRADRARLETLLAELRRQTTELDGSAFLAGKGKLPWPLSGPIRATFGRPRADGRLVWHGMVLSAEEGTPVKAVFRGRVVFADWLRGFGLLTIIDHGSGFMTLYGHADSLTKVVGDWVEAGELIARAGRSGGQTKSGLYFEIRQEGQARDPLGWLTKRKT